MNINLNLIGRSNIGYINILHIDAVWIYREKVKDVMPLGEGRWLADVLKQMINTLWFKTSIYLSLIKFVEQYINIQNQICSFKTNKVDLMN